MAALEHFAKTKLSYPAVSSQINVVIGENDSGKTQLLKLLYSIAKSLDTYSKKQLTTKESWETLLANKLLWTFQPDNFELGKLVNRSSKVPFDVKFSLQQQDLSFGFVKTTSKTIRDCTSPNANFTTFNAVYLPPKEVLSAMDAIDAIDAIDATSKQLQIPGFDHTYIDLIDALRLPVSTGDIDPNLEKALTLLQSVTGGGDIKQEKGEFVFTRGREKYGLRSVAEGIRRISVLSHLIRNRTIKTGSVLFMDEPETNLHPNAIVVLVEMLHLMAKAGVQIYLATHSEFLLKRFEQLARAEQTPDFVQLLSITTIPDDPRHKNGLKYHKSDLKDGLPENPIMEQSLALYHGDVQLDFA
jgi:ABC-type transport system involved in cytochrome c biogenesis ATPase subunit